MSEPSTLMNRCSTLGCRIATKAVEMVCWFLGVAVAWWFLSAAFQIPTYIVPSPYSVASSIVALPQFYLRHFLGTASEAFAGLLIGATFGFFVGIALRYGGPFGRLLTPPMLASSVFPKEALAPVLVSVLGFGMLPKIVISALICFFPVAINTAAGLRARPQQFLSLFSVLGATSWQRFWQLELPFALPYILASLRVSATLSVIGAVVGEFVGGSLGLGHVIRAASADIGTDRVYAALLLLGLLGGLFFWLTSTIEHLILRRYRGLVAREN